MPSMPDCPKFQSCNAPVCPIHPAWVRRLNRKEASTCFYLCESVKHGSHALFQGAGLEEVYKVVYQATPVIVERHPRIRRALDRAKQTGSRMTRRVIKATEATRE